LSQLFARFTTGVTDTGSKFSAGILDTGGNFATGINDTSGTGGAPWLANISANFGKIWNDPNVIIRGLGGDDSWKKLWHCPFKGRETNTILYGVYSPILTLLGREEVSRGSSRRAPTSLLTIILLSATITIL
jgi:hypothetical protein